MIELTEVDYQNYELCEYPFQYVYIPGIQKTSLGYSAARNIGNYYNNDTKFGALELKGALALKNDSDLEDLFEGGTIHHILIS